MRDKFSLVAGLSGPLFGEALLAVSIGSIVILFVGQLGAFNLAALGLANTAINAVLITVAAFGTAIASESARAHGAADGEREVRLAGQVQLYSLVLGPALVVPVYFLSTVVFSNVSDFSGQTIGMALNLLKLYVLFLPLNFFIFNLRGLLQGVGKMRALLMQGIVTSVLGLLAISQLVNRDGIKVYGVPIGGGITLIFGVAVLLMYAARQFGAKTMLANFTRTDWKMLKRLGTLVWPIVLEQAVMQGCILSLTVILARTGEIQFAGYQIALTMIAFPYMVFNCLGAVSLTIAGNFAGERRWRKLFEHIEFVSKAGVVGIFLIGAAFAIFARQVTSLMTAEHNVQAWAEICLGMALLEMPFALIWNVYGCALRGIGDTRWPMYATFAGVAGLRLPLVWLFVACWHYDISIVWIIYAFDSVVRAAIMRLRFGAVKRRLYKIEGEGIEVCQITS